MFFYHKHFNSDSSWKGSRVKLYDSFYPTDSVKIYAHTLQEKLKNGPMFVQMISHGGQQTWNLQKGGIYSISDARSLKNPNFTHITTMACTTNAFDSPNEPNKECLSEAFIRNANSGVISYLGSSRQGFYYSLPIGSLGPSLEYEGEFYSKLLSHSENNNNHYGQLVSVAKREYYEKCKKYSEHRWLQLSLNPMGDCEMPVYTCIPKDLDISLSFENGYVIVRSGTNCRIAFCSLKNGNPKLEYVYPSSRKAQYPLEGSYTICVTKKNYKPIVYEFTNINDTQSVSKVYVSNDKLISEQIASFKIGDNVDILQDGEFCAESAISENLTLSCLNNPVRDEAIFEVNEDVENFCLSANASSVLGKAYTLSTKNEGLRIKVDTSAIPSGFYVISINNNGMKVGECHIVKK